MVRLGLAATLAVTFTVLTACSTVTGAQEGLGSEDEAACVAPAVFEHDFLRANPGAFVLERLTGEDFRAFLQAWNALPPASKLEADALTAFHRDGVRTVALAWYLEDCLLFWGTIPLQAYGALRTRAEPIGWEI